jgi:hypothetical protein
MVQADGARWGGPVMVLLSLLSRRRRQEKNVVVVLIACCFAAVDLVMQWKVERRDVWALGFF